jgi:hypothetical protein
VPVNVPDVDDDASLSFSPNKFELGYVSGIPLLLRGSVEIL